MGVAGTPMRIDIVSDVVCPWCLIGWRQLRQAIAETGIVADVRWHPFELNPAMPAEGEEVAAHVRRKYGASVEQSAATRAAMAEIAAPLGITFQPGVPARMWNTHRAHQLIHWARETGRQTALAEALFAAHFERGERLADDAVLLDAVEAAGLDRDAAADVLASASESGAVRALEARFADMGVTGVPAIIFDERGLVMGAQGPETFARLIVRMIEKRAAAGAG
jgi:predicted DsbA family dithiol-disulfide isomerase